MAPVWQTQSITERCGGAW